MPFPSGLIFPTPFSPLAALGGDDDLLKIARADNIADEAAQQWPQLSIEYIVAMRPEVIIDGQMGSDPRSPSQYWNTYTTIPAVKNLTRSSSSSSMGDDSFPDIMTAW